MPVVFRHEGLRFFFYSNEGNPLEPIHVHAARAGAQAKIWLYPEPSVAASAGFTRQELAKLVAVVAGRSEEIEKAWNEHFSEFRQV